MNTYLQLCSLFFTFTLSFSLCFDSSRTQHTPVLFVLAVRTSLFFILKPGLFSRWWLQTYACLVFKLPSFMLPRLDTITGRVLWSNTICYNATQMAPRELLCSWSLNCSDCLWDNVWRRVFGIATLDCIKLRRNSSDLMVNILNKGLIQQCHIAPW